MREFRADLHVHTVLSSCAEVEMIPPLIVQQSLKQNIDLIAITDHNASANVGAVRKAAEGTRLTVLPGIEVQSREEVHLLALFETLEVLDTWQRQVDVTLPELKNDTAFFGEQFIVDETGGYLRSEPRLLLTSVNLSIDEIFERVSALGGIVIPAHVERTMYGLLPTLGLVSEKWKCPALEISRRTTPEEAIAAYPALRSYPLIQSGDVHRLDEFLGVTRFKMDAPNLMEIHLALGKIAGRKMYIEPIAGS